MQKLRDVTQRILVVSTVSRYRGRAIPKAPPVKGEAGNQMGRAFARCRVAPSGIRPTESSVTAWGSRPGRAQRRQPVGELGDAVGIGDGAQVGLEQAERLAEIAAVSDQPLDVG
jgi:hypothetical protein